MWVTTVDSGSRCVTDITNISGGRPVSFRTDRINTTVQPRWTSIHILEITFSLGSNCSTSPQRFVQSRPPTTIIGGLGTGFWGSHCAKRKSLHCKSGCQTLKKSITCSLYRPNNKHNPTQTRQVFRVRTQENTL